ncbi:MFS transporter, partial [Streptomyces sp. NPDC003860]
VSFAPASAPVLFGLNSSAVFLGVAMGGGLGGIAQDWIPVTSLGLPAAFVALVATVLTIVHATKAKTGASTEAVRASR